MTLNSTVIYDLAFNATATSTFEFVLDQYLSGISGNTISSVSSLSAINAYLDTIGSAVEFQEYASAGSYASGGVVTEALAQTYLDASDCGLLLAA